MMMSRENNASSWENRNKLDGLLNKLNEEQRKAVCSRNDQIIVMAGPGTGKFHHHCFSIPQARHQSLPIGGYFPYQMH